MFIHVSVFCSRKTVGAGEYLLYSPTQGPLDLEFKVYMSRDKVESSLLSSRRVFESCASSSSDKVELKVQGSKNPR